MKSLVQALVINCAIIAAAPSYAAQNTLVLMETSQGSIKLEINHQNAPVSAENFLRYVRSGFYDGTIFHRVIDGFMIQGGGFDPKMNKKETQAPIQNEADNGLKNLRGTLAMARTQDPHSATAQFFINHKDNGFLDFKAKNPQGWGYAVFGRVIEGMDVVDKIAKTPTGMQNGMKDVPVSPVMIQKAKVVTQ